MPLALKTEVDQLTAVIEPDGDRFLAICPELDLVASETSPEEALSELVSEAIIYAEEYLTEEDLYRKDPVRVRHAHWIHRITSSPDESAVRRLFTE